MNKDVEIYDAIEKALDDLFAGNFLTMQDYVDCVANGGLTNKRKWAADLEFQQQYVDHPLNSEYRGIRIVSADSIRDLTMEWQSPLPDEILKKMHIAMFDCCSAVRLSMAHALFNCGSKLSVLYLEKLLREENESQIVREYVIVALERCRMRGIEKLPEGKKVIMLVSQDIQLVIALHSMAAEKGALLYMPQYNYTEMIVWSSRAVVQVVDRGLMGQNCWNSFCDYLEDVNETIIKYPLKDGNGEILMEEPIYDYTPLIITDWNLKSFLKDFRNPDKPKEALFYVECGNNYIVTQLVEKYL